MNMNKCKFCGNNLPEKGKKGPPKQYCNVICRMRYWESHELLKDTGRFCKYCGKPLNYKQKNQCSDCFSKACERKQKRKVEQNGSKTKVCGYCGTSFLTDKRTKNRQRCCSEKCASALYCKKNPVRNRSTFTFICENCGKEYTTGYKERDTYCSRECGMELRTKQALVEKKCLSCGKIFVVKKSGWNYCSASCRKRGALNTCKICGNEFYSRNKGASICSNECQNKINLQKFRDYKLSIGRNQGRTETLICKCCGKEFKHKIYNQIPDYCSLKCVRKVNKLRRRAQKYGNGQVDTIYPIKVYERDGWHCGICRKKVRPLIKYPHPASASLDHIVALANGGEHIWSNVQCAHLRCNVLKSNIGGGQLRLRISGGDE